MLFGNTLQKHLTPLTISYRLKHLVALVPRCIAQPCCKLVLTGCWDDHFMVSSLFEGYWVLILFHQKCSYHSSSSRADKVDSCNCKKLTLAFHATWLLCVDPAEQRAPGQRLSAENHEPLFALLLRLDSALDGVSMQNTSQWRTVWRKEIKFTQNLRVFLVLAT